MDSLTLDPPGRRLGEAVRNFEGEAELPPESPLAMPVQCLRRTAAAPGRPATSPPRAPLRRAALWLAVTAVTLAGTASVFGELRADTFGPLDWPVLAVFAFLFSWSALAFFTTCAGLRAKLGGHQPLDIDPTAPRDRLITRTAILSPIYNEEPHRVFGRIQAVCEDLMTVGENRRFDLFVLSDTSQDTIQLAERRAFAKLRRAVAGRMQVYYRHRPQNIDRKAGNIAEWVRRFGGAYDFMVVLDADSLMTGDTLARLAGAMQRAPGVGVIQTLPMVVGRASLLGRVQQFASRLYGPLIGHGVAWWSGAEGNYWGHNAIIRVDAFAAQAGLPHLPGPAPLGGSIMSHDFVEAALIRRGGYAVHIAPQLTGSYEGCPPSLADLIKRDRRWCQGNLQHLGVVAAKGLHWVSRFHMLTGLFAYVTAPLWLALLALNLLLDAYPVLGRVHGAPAGAAAASGHAGAAPWTFIIALMFFLAPRAAAFATTMADAEQRRAFGGWRRTLAGVAIETLVSALVTPVVMVSQTVAVGALLLGRDFGWTAQRRSERPAKFVEAVRRHWGHTAVGVALGCTALALARGSVLWLSPIVPSLVLSAPLADLIGRRDLGLYARRKGLLATPEEVRPPAVVARADALARDYWDVAEPAPARRLASVDLEPTLRSLAFTAGSAPEPADLPAAG